MTTTTSAIPLPMKTLLEPNDIRILPQNRFTSSENKSDPSRHISVLEDAKRYINNLGTHELLDAYISPSHSGYAAKKLSPQDVIGAGHRLSVIYLAIENIDWVMVDLFEMFQPCKTSLSIVIEAFLTRVHSQLPHGAQTDVFWLKGEDALFHSRSPDNLIRLGVHSMYVVNRGGNVNMADTNNQFKSIEDFHVKRWQEVRALSSFPEKIHLVQATHMNLSSTTIRACAHDPSTTREQLLSCVQLENVTTYIIQHQLWSTRLDAQLTTELVPSIFLHAITDLTPEILSSMLCAYSYSSVKVISFMFQQIGVGTGWNGSIYRLYNIQYLPDSMNCPPPSIILKLSTGIWQQRVASIEPDFYSKLGPRISNIEIPKSYYLARHPHSPNESLLLLEDLSVNYEPLGSKESIEDSTIFLLVASIATLHAEFFNHPLLQQEMFAWLPTLNSTLTHYHTEYSLRMADKEFTQLLESKVSSKAYVYAKALVTHIPHLFQALVDEHYTLSHGDLWINNVYMRRNQSHRLVIFDWQTCCRANGLIDVVFLLRLFDTDRVRLLESQALDLYHQMLIKYGVSNYDASTIRNDYYSLALPFMCIIISSLKNLKDSKIKKLIMMLEDIVTYGKKSERTTCDCDLGI